MEFDPKRFAKCLEEWGSQTRVSKESGVHMNTLTAWKKEGANPRVNDLVAACKAMNISVAYVLREVELPSPNHIMTLDAIVDESVLGTIGPEAIRKAVKLARLELSVAIKRRDIARMEALESK